MEITGSETARQRAQELIEEVINTDSRGTPLMIQKALLYSNAAINHVLVDSGMSRHCIVFALHLPYGYDKLLNHVQDDIPSPLINDLSHTCRGLPRIAKQSSVCIPKLHNVYGWSLKTLKCQALHKLINPCTSIAPRS